MKRNDGDYGYEMVEYGNGGLAVQQRSPWCAGATMVRACYFTRQHIYLLGDYRYGMVEYGNGGLAVQQRSPWCAGATMVRTCYFIR